MKTFTPLNNISNINNISNQNLKLNFNKNSLNTVFPSITSSHMDKLVNIKEYQDNLVNKNNSSINNDISIKNNVQYSLSTLSQYVKDFKSYLQNYNNGGRADAYTNINNSNKQDKFLITNSNLNSTIKKEINYNSLNNLNNKVALQQKLSFLNLYPNLDDQFKNNGILDLKIKNIKQYVNLISKFKSEIHINQQQAYSFSKGNKASMPSNNYIYELLDSCFNPMHAFISKPKIVFSFNKVEIKLFFYIWQSKIKSNSLNNSNFLTINNERLEFVCEKLSKLYNLPIVLELTRLHNPYSDSNILANAIGPLGNYKRLSKVRDGLIKKAKIINPTKIYNKRKSLLDLLGIVKSSSFLSGIKIRVAGRLLLEGVIPRRTVKSFQKGSLARSKANYVKTERFVSKNRRGSYSVTVTIGHGIK